MILIRISEAHILPTIRIIHIAGVSSWNCENQHFVIYKLGFHFTCISHICLLFSKWNTQLGHILPGVELQHHHIIMSKLLSQWNKTFSSLLLIATSPYYNIETIVSMEHKISFTIVYMEHEIFFMIASALLLWIRIAWLGIIETEYEKNDNKNHLRIF